MALTYLKIMRGMSDGCYLLYHQIMSAFRLRSGLPEQEAIPP